MNVYRLLTRSAAAGLAAAVLSVPASAEAAPPQGSERETFDANVVVVDEFLSEECGFEVLASISGHYFERVFFDKAGNVTRSTAHPSFRSTLTSPYATLSTADVGLDRFVENPDGTISIFGTGIHLKFKGGTKAIGLWRLVYDPVADQLVDEQYFGQFDVGVLGLVGAVCTALGPGT